MQKYKKVAINIAFLTMILSAGIMTNYFSDSDQDFELNLNNKKASRESQEKQEKLLSTFENSDYQAWKKIIGQNNKVSHVINEAAFNDFISARIAARSGEYDKALEITENLKKDVENKLT
ncbi:MAG: hypothetical protein WCK59_04245 [Candidatus Falkowbacteria bacterium]